jgi:uncharacterized protein YbjQ (UPF0145 family)
MDVELVHLAASQGQSKAPENQEASIEPHDAKYFNAVRGTDASHVFGDCGDTAEPGQPARTGGPWRAPVVTAAAARKRSVRTVDLEGEVARQPGYSNASGARDRLDSGIPHLKNTSMIPHHMTTTAFTIDGYRIKRNLGVVRGVVVRSRSVLGSIGAGLQTIVGGNITLFTELCEKTRSDAFELMLAHAVEVGANAVVGARYDATEVMSGVTEVIAYGTAVVVEPVTA